MFRSCDYPIGAQRGDLGLAVAVFAQHLIAVLADPGGPARRHLFLPGEGAGAVDRPQLRVVGIGLQETGSQHLLVMAYIVDPAAPSRDQPDLVELLAPVRRGVSS